MNLQEQIRKVLREFILIETEGADPNNPDSHPDLDDWGSDSWWTFEDWKTWYNANVQKYGENKAKQTFARHWMAVEEGTGVGTKNDLDVNWLKKEYLWNYRHQRVYTKDEMVRSLKTVITRPTPQKKEQKQENKFVVFVSGIQDTENHEAQTNRFVNGFGKKYPVKSFNFTNKNEIDNFLKSNENEVVALVLFSAGCGLANTVNFPSNKIYCIEPWNDSKGSRNSIYSNIPEQNMFINSKISYRGAGTKTGNNVNYTDDFGNHFDALSKSAAILSNRI